MEKLNLAELLRDCQKGMELDCTVYDNCILENVFEGELYPIKIETPEGFMHLTKYGSFSLSKHSKCVIFPKGKTTWKGFQKPFKDGDVLYVDCTNECDDKQYDYIFILDKIYNGQVCSYCHYYIPKGEFQITDSVARYLTDDQYPIRLATEEEKQKLFDAIKANGYRWNAETKTLEKLIEPKFKIGDIIKDKCNLKWKVINGNSHYYEVSLVLTDTSKLIEIKAQDDYELVPKKFNITTLKPFESRVLVRDYNTQIWIPTFWGKHLKDDSNCSYLTTNGCYKYCIPYKGNEHLLGITNDCEEYFKTWK